MWEQGWRDLVWSQLDHTWDIIVIGGGITGAGILREATHLGLKTLLLEAHDFSSGTSSRSSKLVHGGFRYLRNAQIRVTLESVRERERLLKEGRGLVNQLGFLLASYRGDHIPTWMFGTGLALYDLLALKWSYRYYDSFDLRELCPHLKEEGLKGGYRYFDAQTDDARLVLRIIWEAVRAGGLALNYAFVSDLLRDTQGQVRGVVIVDQSSEGKGRHVEIQSSLVINATGAWADNLRSIIGGRQRLRKLRGSHLVFSTRKLPLTRAVSFLHPKDGRAVFVFPWEGVSVIGTTDVDHGQQIQTDPAISEMEVEYLLQAGNYAFPELGLKWSDVQATFSGIRPVVGTGKVDPSKESREHVLWLENGLLTVAGGKLTTFRLMARDALRAASKKLRLRIDWRGASQRVLDSSTGEAIASPFLSPKARLRLVGRYGAQASELVETASSDELRTIGETPFLWAELRWASRSGGAVHLDDLLMRRLRLGLLLPHGGLDLAGQIRTIVQSEMGWDDRRWMDELKAYSLLWEECYHGGEEQNPSPEQSSPNLIPV